MTTQRHSRGVAAKRGGIALHPAERGLDVHDAVIGEGMVLRIQRGMRQEAKETQTIVDCYSHGWNADRSSTGQLASVIVRRCAVDIAAAVNPDNNREAAGLRSVSFAEPGCEDVQVKAVLVHARRAGKHTQRRHLRTDVAKMSRIPRFLPLRNRLGRHPTPLAYRRGGVRNTPEFVNAIPNETSDWTLSCVYNRSCLVAGGYASAACCRK